MRVEIQGFIGLLIFVAVVWAIVQTVQSSASTGAKVLWIVALLLLPVLGFLIWFFVGPRPGRLRN